MRSIDESAAAPRSETGGSENASRVLELLKLHILLIDKWNGSGHGVVVPSPLKKTLIRPLLEGPMFPSQAAPTWTPPPAGTPRTPSAGL